MLIYKNNGRRIKEINKKRLANRYKILLFLINAWKFINNPGSEVPILTILFSVIIYLAIIILIIYKDEMKLVGYFQNHIDKYK